MSDLDLLYGKCRLNDKGRCLCLKEEASVALCPHWVSISTLVGKPILEYADLVVAMQTIRDENENRIKKDEKRS